MNGIESRVAELADQFRQIGAAQMRDLPIYNDRLDVEAVGFQALGERWIGVLITPWFMSAIFLPQVKTAPDAKLIGQKSQEALPSATYAFVNGGVEAVGSYKSLPLHSPMGAFKSQEDARREAQVRLNALLTPPADTPMHAPATREAAAQSPGGSSRRAFLFGRARETG